MDFFNVIMATKVLFFAFILILIIEPRSSCKNFEILSLNFLVTIDLLNFQCNEYFLQMCSNYLISHFLTKSNPSILYCMAYNQNLTEIFYSLNFELNFVLLDFKLFSFAPSLFLLPFKNYQNEMLALEYSVS